MTYEKPTITEIGSVKDLTQGQWFADGQDSLSWVNKVINFQLFGS